MPTHHDIPGVEIFGSGAANFTLPGGFVDSKGVVHREIYLREMTGKEDDELDNTSLIASERINRILSACIEKIGTVTDRKIIEAAVTDNLATVDPGALPLTSQDRLAALLFLRIVTLGAAFNIESKCPTCKFKNKNKQINLRGLEITKQEDPKRRRARVRLPQSKKEVIIRVLTAQREVEVSLLDKSSDPKLCAILARLESLDSIALPVTSQALELIRVLPRVDREFIQDTYAMMEGSVDTVIEISCNNKECKKEYISILELGIPFFLQPGKEHYPGGMDATTGRSFSAFLPLGVRANLESELVALFEADYIKSYEDFLKIPCSRRQRLIKMREMIIDKQNGKSSDLSTLPATLPTGLGNQNKQVTPSTRLFGGNPGQ